MRHFTCIAFLAALTLAPALGAQAPAATVKAPAAADRLKIGNVELTLGMEEKPALAALKRQFHVERARGTGEDWAILRNGETVAVVSFSDGKLARASKTWYSTSSRDAATMADRLFSLADEFAGDGHTECTLSARPYRMGGVEGKIVTLACGSKSIQFNESRMARGGIATSLREVLQ
jgi:hypothetical protein